MQKFKPKYT